MSRSYKKQPFQSICGGASAKHDKQLAARGVRRRQNEYLKHNADCEDFLIPHLYECAWNEVYNWNRDGNQMWQGDLWDLAHINQWCADDTPEDTWLSRHLILRK